MKSYCSFHKRGRWFRKSSDRNDNRGSHSSETHWSFLPRRTVDTCQAPRDGLPSAP